MKLLFSVFGWNIWRLIPSNLVRYRDFSLPPILYIRTKKKRERRERGERKKRRKESENEKSESRNRERA